ncbi:hypothetical protein [Candidatus Binatus sp.]|uniref:hypothetical protein n=1 Tax=Candidatus Binatus sp. TaxID=2811406 RepID=UPI003C501534
MKITSRLALAAAFLLILATSLYAGTVEFGLLNSSQYDKWLCDPSMPPPEAPTESRCKSAKFQECSDSCDTIAVTNNSDAAVEVKFEFSGVGFSEKDTSGVGFWGSCLGPDGEERSYSNPDSCGHLLPGKHCAAAIIFCPQQSGTSRGQVKATITEGGKSRTTIFDLVADANYSPELQAADKARRRHLDELMKIPHVETVTLDPKDDDNHDIFINVEVDDDGSLDKVRRAAPPKIEGYDVEVTRYIEVGYGE